MENTDRSILVTTESELEKAIAGKERVIALFYATWCLYFIKFLPVFRKYTKGRDDILLIEDDRWQMTEKYKVEVVPSALCFENGKVIKRLDGVLGLGLNENELEEFIEVCSLK